MENQEGGVNERHRNMGIIATILIALIMVGGLFMVLYKISHAPEEQSKYWLDNYIVHETNGAIDSITVFDSIVIKSKYWLDNYIVHETNGAIDSITVFDSIVIKRDSVSYYGRIEDDYLIFKENDVVFGDGFTRTFNNSKKDRTPSERVVLYAQWKYKKHLRQKEIESKAIKFN